VVKYVLIEPDMSMEALNYSALACTTKLRPYFQCRGLDPCMAEFRRRRKTLQVSVFRKKSARRRLSLMPTSVSESAAAATKRVHKENYVLVMS